MAGKLSIVIPVYNEQRTVRELVRAVLAVELPLEKELLVVDDGSSDNTWPLLQELAVAEPAIRLMRNEANRGKGYSVRRGIEAATGDIVVIQDADLEYNPQEYPKLLRPILSGRADVVYGSRFISDEPKRVLYFWHSVGNRLLTFFSNMISNLNLSDMETCYKCFRREIIQGIRLQENRFGFEPEVTFKLSRLKRISIYEVGISYHGRTYEEGKKIGWRDGVRTFYVLVKYGLLYRVLGQRLLRKPPAEVTAPPAAP